MHLSIEYQFTFVLKNDCVNKYSPLPPEHIQPFRCWKLKLSASQTWFKKHNHHLPKLSADWWNEKDYSLFKGDSLHTTRKSLLRWMSQLFKHLQISKPEQNKLIFTNVALCWRKSGTSVHRDNKQNTCSLTNPSKHRSVPAILPKKVFKALKCA